MGLFSLKETCWKNLLLLSTAAVCSCICVLQTQFIQEIDCLTYTHFPSPLFSLLSRPVCLDVPFEVSQKALIADMLCLDLTDRRKQKLSLTPCPLEVVIPLCSHTSGMFPFVQAHSDTQLWSCVIVLPDDFQDFILCNNLIAIWYSNSAHNLLRCFVFMVLLVPLLVHFYTLIFMVLVAENLIPHHHLFWGWFAEKTYSCIAVTYFAVFFCVSALQVLDPGSRFPALPSALLR